MNITPDFQDLITALFAGFLAAIGYLIKGQITTNKELSSTITNAVLEFKTAITDFNARDKVQQQSCEYHRRATDDLKNKIDKVEKHVDTELRRIHIEITSLKNNR